MKKLLALLLFLAAPAYSAVLVDTSSVSGIQSGISFNTWTHTIGTGINRAIVVGCEMNVSSPTALSSATVGAATMTFVRASGNSPELDRAELWILVNPPSGAQTITVYGPSGSGYHGEAFPCGAISFENVNQFSPVDTSTGSYTGEVSWTTTASTEMLVDVIGEGASSTAPVVEAGQTLAWSNTDTPRVTAQAGSYKAVLSSGTQIMGWTTVGSPGAMAAIALKPAAGSPDISILSPQARGIGQGSFTITVNGQGFVSGSTVTWNGANRVTTFVSSTQLTAVILSTDTASIALIPVRVINPNTARSGPSIFNVTGDLNYIWATDGGYKPTQEDLYGLNNSTTVTNTRIWDGHTISPFQAKNELNGFALILENNTTVNSSTVSVAYPILTGPNGYVLSSTVPAKAQMADWRNRPIEVYKVGYVPINGLSRFHWENYDERQVPERMQQTYTTGSFGEGIGVGGWASRPDHDKHYPDILEPVEAITGSTFSVTSQQSQAIWIDIYIPKTAPAGLYTGTVNVYEGAAISSSIPISLTVYPFTMPDSPPAKAYAYVSEFNINNRHQGQVYPNYTTVFSSYTQTRIHYYQELHRFGIMPLSDNICNEAGYVSPCPEYQMALDGSLYSDATGYANAPGVSTPDTVFAIGIFGGWHSAHWLSTYASTCQNATTWVNWFQSYQPKAEYWWYIVDEPGINLALTNQYSTWITTCPAPGNQLETYVTDNVTDVLDGAPNITHIATTRNLGVPATEAANYKKLLTDGKKRMDFYVGDRPWTGTMNTEDDGVAPLVTEWMQYKMKFDHYFYWETTYWQDGNNTGRENDLFHDGLTFGYFNSTSLTFGRTSFNYANGEGVLMYPGTDVKFPNDSLGIDVPLPSWRLMMWRRGINDFTYLTLAAQYDSTAVNNIVQATIPKVLWEYGIVDPNDPTYQYTGISWSRDPDVWVRAREKLANIIAKHR